MYKIVIASFILLFSLCLTGCNTSAYEVKKKGEKKEHVSIAFSYTNQEEASYILEKIEEFHYKHKNIMIEPSFYDQEHYMDIVKGEIQNNLKPDICYIDAPLYIERDFERYFLPLSSVELKKMGVSLSDYDRRFLNAFKKNGKLYAVPRGLHEFILFYNKAWLEELKIEVPNTSKQLTEAMHKMMKEKNKYGMGYRTYQPFFLTMAIEANGSIEKNGKASFATAPIIKTLEPIVEAIHFTKLMVQPSTVASHSLPQGFGQEKYGMMIENNTAIYYLRSLYPQAQWGVAPIPKWEGKNINTPTITGYAIVKKKKIKPSTYTVLSYFTSESVEDALAIDGIEFPARLSSQALMKRERKEWYDALSQIDTQRLKNEEQIIISNKVRIAFKEALEESFLFGGPLSEILKSTEKEVNKDIKMFQ